MVRIGGLYYLEISAWNKAEQATETSLCIVCLLAVVTSEPGFGYIRFNLLNVQNISIAATEIKAG